MQRRCAATATNKCCSGLGEAAAEIGKIRRRGSVGDPTLLIIWAAGIGVDRQRLCGRDLFHQTKHCLGTVDAVEAYKIGALDTECLQQLPDPCAPGKASTLGRGDEGDHRFVGK